MTKPSKNHDHYTQSFSKSKRKSDVYIFTFKWQRLKVQQFFYLYMQPQNETDSILPSKLEIAFLLDSGVYGEILSKLSMVVEKTKKNA